MQSKQFSLNNVDRKKLLHDALYFFLIPLGFYISAVLGAIQQPDHILTLQDFVPTNTTLIVIVAWLLNQALSAIRKCVR
jgi:hypothetical protein